MKCPNCNTDLNATETFDFGWVTGDDEKMWASVGGFCPACRRTFLWTQHYTLVKEDNLEDEDEDECYGDCPFCTRTDCDDRDTTFDEDDCDGNCDECNEQCFVEEPDDLGIGFNPYMGEYDYDC